VYAAVRHGSQVCRDTWVGQDVSTGTSGHDTRITGDTVAVTLPAMQ
jgi:hypothetical protein